MSRVKRGTIANKKRKGLLSHTKGFKWGRKSKFRAAKEALLHAWDYSYRDRKVKKRQFRSLWQIQINAACRKEGRKYSQFANSLSKSKIEIDRKILAKIAKEEPEIFKEILNVAK